MRRRYSNSRAYTVMHLPTMTLVDCGVAIHTYSHPVRLYPTANRLLDCPCRLLQRRTSCIPQPIEISIGVFSRLLCKHTLPVSRWDIEKREYWHQNIVIRTDREFAEKLVALRGFLVVCLLYKTNPNPRKKYLLVGKRWPKCHF